MLASHDILALSLYLFCFALSIVATVSSALVLRYFAPRLGLVDIPNFRSLHTKQIPRVGGLAIQIGFFGTVLILALLKRFAPFPISSVIDLPDGHLLMGAAIIGISGMIDDMHGLSSRNKLLFQSLAAIILILSDRIIPLSFPMLGVELNKYVEAFAVPITFIWILGVINAVNLIDGMDGLAGGIATITLLSLSFVLVASGQPPRLALTFTLVGATLGFLILNYHPAKIFMGDAGSLFLGYILAASALVPYPVSGANWLFFIAPVCAVGLPVLDTFTSIARRQLKGRPAFCPDRDHIHHRMKQVCANKQRSAVLHLYGVQVAFGAMAILLATVSNLLAPLIVLITLVLIAFLLQRLGYVTFREDLKRLRRPPVRPSWRQLLSNNNRQARDT